ncbi:MAG: hypothetical protein MUO84_07105 [Thermoplasmata archaeon]|nr:hypothetical protein [Thermoplasmata archaeon]
MKPYAAIRSSVVATRSGPKLPISVEQQKLMLDGYDPSDPDLSQALVAFFLSTGTHPCVLAEPRRFNVRLSSKYYSYERPKTRKHVALAWSRYMRDNAIPDLLQDHMGSTIQWYGQLTARCGPIAGIPDRVGPLRLRHDYFSNLARRGYDPFFIANRAGTNLQTIAKYYTVGRSEIEVIDEDLRIWLKVLMDP